MDSEKSGKPYRIVRVRSNEFKDRYISNKPGSIVRVSGCEFHLFRYIDEYTEQECADLPCFDENPEYTDEGKPFITTLDNACPHGKSDAPDASDVNECADCVWCYTENPTAAIGVCMCEERKLKSQEEQTK